MISIVTALDCEARPLIQYFKLKRCQLFRPFPLYIGDDVHLAVCGIGKLNALSTTSALAGIHAGNAVMRGVTVSESAWFNVGIAGHSRHEIGDAYLVHKVTDTVSMASSFCDASVGVGKKNKTYYPLWAGKWPCKSENLITVSEPVTDYLTQAIYDMEGSGFCEAAYRYSTLELVHVLKVISDNKIRPADLIDKAMVTRLIENQIPLIVSVIEGLQQVSQELSALADNPPEYDFLLSQYRVSVSVQFQLKQLLRRWQLLESGSILEVVSPNNFQSIKHWIKAANLKVEGLPVSFSK